MLRRKSFASPRMASSTLRSPVSVLFLNNRSNASAGYTSSGVGVFGLLHEMCEL